MEIFELSSGQLHENEQVHDLAERERNVTETSIWTCSSSGQLVPEGPFILDSNNDFEPERKFISPSSMLAGVYGRKKMPPSRTKSSDTLQSWYHLKKSTMNLLDESEKDPICESTISQRLLEHFSNLNFSNINITLR
ncbi:hypothetical protein Ciccas_000373 [Cichlidogyrus casuarinus]|uniref:Uncharacterized protein n=1 Tax=Cichlidogyrus casuarinus TaxID=1844966 RepID=A0ABD2QN67_9PLAT